MESTPLFCFGHRGACGHEPENTLRSIRSALALGADGIEVDVHLADDRVVVIHDDTLERTTNGSGEVAAASLPYLKSLDAGGGESIPLLSEVFDVVSRQALVNVELKGNRTAAPVAELIGVYVRNGWSVTDFLLSSFDPAQLMTVRSTDPRIATALLTEEATGNQIDVALQIGVRSIHPAQAHVTAAFVNAAHQAGLKVFAFTVNEAADIERMRRFGVDGVFSDYPERVLRATRDA